MQEASGKTSNLSRGDRAVLKEIDGKTTHANVAAKFDKIPAAKFDALIQQFDKDGYIREVSSGAQPAAAAPPVRSAPPAKTWIERNVTARPAKKVSKTSENGAAEKAPAKTSPNGSVKKSPAVVTGGAKNGARQATNAAAKAKTKSAARAR